MAKWFCGVSLSIPSSCCSSKVFKVAWGVLYNGLTCWWMRNGRNVKDPVVERRSVASEKCKQGHYQFLLVQAPPKPQIPVKSDQQMSQEASPVWQEAWTAPENVSTDTCTYFMRPNSGKCVTSVCQISRLSRPLGLTPVVTEAKLWCWQSGQKSNNILSLALS